jgi:hypothetical protein
MQGKPVSYARALAEFKKMLEFFWANFKVIWPSFSKNKANI